MKKLLTPIIVTMFSFLVACSALGRENSPYLTPELTWDSDISEIESVYGTETESYETEENGKGYQYKYTYDGLDGNLNFVFDENGQLYKVSFQSVIDSEDDYDSICKKWSEEFSNKYGQPHFENESGTLWIANDEAISLLHAELVTDLFTYRTLGIICNKAPEDGFQIDSLENF